MNQSEEIKSKIDIVDLIREYIPLKAVGANFQALCPFHQEKSPSFVVSPDKQIWHCFGCGRGGDIFSFVMEKESLNFIEALRLLASKAGVVLHYDNSQNYSQRNRLLDILALANKYYQHLLMEPLGKAALDYLLKRNLTLETIRDWHLGYSLGTETGKWDSLYTFLKKRPLQGQKYTDEEIFAAGLTIKKKQKSTGETSLRSPYYDRFRGRIMFPIWDVNDNVIAFTARINPAQEKEEKLGKYINSPQSLVYDKSRVLFALNKAKMAIKEQDLAIVVEGQMDVISSHQHGFQNIVASSGTALTMEQVKLLHRYTDNVALLFDMDQAGQLAMDRGIKEVLRQGLNLKIIILPEYKDPDECLQKKPAVFQQAIAEAQSMLDYYFSKISKDVDLQEIDNKRQVRDQMFKMIALVSSKTEQGYWLKKISEELGFFEDDTREEFLKWSEKNKSGFQKEPEKELAPPPRANREDKLAESLLALLIKFPEFINYSVNNLEPKDFSASDLAEFYKNFIIYYNKEANLDYENLKKYFTSLTTNASQLLDKLILLGEKDFYSYEGPQVKTELINIISELKKYSKHRKINQLQRAISQAEKDGEQEDLEKLMADLKNLTNS